MMRTSSVRSFLRLALIAMAFCLAKWAAPTFSMASAPVDNDMEISFGKHCGRLISEIVEEDPSYLQWALRKREDPKSSEQLLEVAEYVREYFPEVEGQTKVIFGKHKGKTFQAVLEEDEDYICWLINNVRTARGNQAALISFGKQHAACWGGVEVDQVWMGTPVHFSDIYELRQANAGLKRNLNL